MDNNHAFASPGPAGLMVLGFYLGCLFPVATGQAPHEMAIVLVALGFIGGIVQLVAGVIELRNGMILPGNILCAFSAFMFLGMGENLFKALKLMPANSASVDGYIFTIMGILMVGFTAPFLYKSLADGLFMITTDIFFVGAGLSWLLGIPVLFTIAKWDLPLVILAILWCVIAEVNNTVFGKIVIPKGAPILGKSLPPSVDIAK